MILCPSCVQLEKRVTTHRVNSATPRPASQRCHGVPSAPPYRDSAPEDDGKGLPSDDSEEKELEDPRVMNIDASQDERRPA